MNVICEVNGNRIANDKNLYLIEMRKGLLKNLEMPNEISKELYNKARTEYYNKANIEFDNFMIGLIG
jgi:DNA adenine methylase